MANIYDDVIFSTTDAYSINDVVYVDDLDIYNAGWHSRSYFYSLTDHAASATYPNHDSTNWGGWELAPITSKYKPSFLWLPSYNVQSNHEPRVKKIALKSSRAVFDSLYLPSVLFKFKLLFPYSIYRKNNK